MKAIVTGAAGFIGSHVVSALLDRKVRVVGIDNLSRPGNVTNLARLQTQDESEFSFAHADIRCMSDVGRVFQANSEAEVVIHQAAQVAVTTSVADPRSDFEANALGTFNVLEATRQFLRPGAIFLCASTNKVYGKMDHVPVTERQRRYSYTELDNGVGESERLDFHSPYGCSKGCAEQYVRDYSRIFGLRSVVFRQSCIYGPHQFGMEDQGWVAWFTIAAVLGKDITIYGDGKQVRDLLWIRDLVDLYLRALDRIDVAAGKIYNAGGSRDNTLSLLELLDLLEELLGMRIVFRHADWRPGDQKVFVADCSMAARELDWLPTVSPKQGVEELFRWVKENREMISQIIGR